MQIQFLGAADTVTGSRHLVTMGEQRILLDCGLFQGYKVLRERNWAPLGVPPHEIDAVVLSRTNCAASFSTWSCKALSRANSAGSSRQRPSGLRRQVPLPEHGASTST